MAPELAPHSPDFHINVKTLSQRIPGCATAQCRRCDEAATPKCLGGPPVARDRRNAKPVLRPCLPQPQNQWLKLKETQFREYVMREDRKAIHCYRTRK
ncbi:hypothetical protein TNCV_926661 [Trichonephila clavipes]|nr:hypothetical protein TNCV_926661 [Trichonephila clavipes]